MAPSPVTTDPFILAAVALLLAAPAVFLFLRGRKPWLSRVRRKPLLTANESEFFHRLQRALPGFHVFPQVSFAAFLTDDGQLSRKAQWAVRAKFDRKIADFVVCERGSLKVVAVVELDDRMHDRRRPTGSAMLSRKRRGIRRSGISHGRSPRTGRDCSAYSSTHSAWMNRSNR